MFHIISSYSSLTLLLLDKYMKFAVIRTGGKQYVVSKGDVLDVELLNKEEGDKVIFEVLLLGDDKDVTVGTPLLKTSVEGKVVKEYQDDKVWGIKYKPKKRYRKKFGHRQRYTQVEIVSL